jgi:capsular exopolysaccharide synthesis family protein
MSLRQAPLYEASAEVLLARQNLAATLTGTQDPTVYQQAERVAETQAQLATVPDVAQRTIDAVGVDGLTVREFLELSSVSAERNADLLEFTVQSESRALAEQLSTEYARQFTQYRLELDTHALVLAREEVETQIAELEAQGDQTSPLYASLIEKEQQLRTMEALQTSNAFVVRNAERADQVRPTPIRNGLIAAALGLLLGIMLAFLWEALDTRVRSAEEIGATLGLPLLARLPMPGRRLRGGNKLVMLTNPRSVQAEAFRMLRTNVEFVNLERGARTIMVTSAVQSEGKSTTIANLAVAYALAGRRVALVDLDLRRPFVARFFNAEGRAGVTDVAVGRLDLEHALVPVELVRGTGADADRRAGGELAVLPCGSLPPDAGEFVGTRALGAILRNLRERFDLVLIDAPPLLNVGDALALSARVDALLIVTRLKVIKRGMLGELQRILETAPAEKLGFAVTDAGAEDGYGRSYGYGYGYGHAATNGSGSHPAAVEGAYAGVGGRSA